MLKLGRGRALIRVCSFGGGTLRLGSWSGGTSEMLLAGKDCCVS